jgi:hypothetical protein
MTEGPVKVAAEHRFAVLAAALTSRAGVSLVACKKKCFGSAALCFCDEIFALLSSKAEFVVKLPAARVESLVAEGDGRYFELGHGRSMREWFVAGAGLEESWSSLAEQSLACMRGECDEP